MEPGILEIDTSAEESPPRMAAGLEWRGGSLQQLCVVSVAGLREWDGPSLLKPGDHKLVSDAGHER